METKITDADNPPICDYEGSDYRTRFWENADRDYEDRVERIAMRRLLPPRGRRLLEIGTGFGRLVELYQGYEHVVLLDYSKSLLREAQQRLGAQAPGGSPRYTYVAADVYRLPLLDGRVDTACMVRVMHHLADVPRALGQIRRALSPGGAFVLEYASKRHLKSIARYLARRQAWSPFDRTPVEFVELNFDFHPRWMHDRLGECGLVVERTRAVSTFRMPLLKRVVPTAVLAALDGAVQWTGEWGAYSPSVFVRARAQGVRGASAEEGAVVEDPTLLFGCPACEGGRLRLEGVTMVCWSCAARWAIDDGIYDFKTPLA